jgi:intracellular sulfur oxidation DsrE/DsrF family protein
MMTAFKQLILLCSLALPTTLTAESLDEILALKEPPTGVVIEIIESGATELKALLPQIRNAANEIRQRFPELPIAVVSHGREQFALTSKNITKDAKLQTGVKRLVDTDIDVHVCGTHASWYDVTPEDYPDYINVSETGPAQINDYINVGYIMLDL